MEEGAGLGGDSAAGMEGAMGIIGHGAGGGGGEDITHITRAVCVGW